MIDFLGNSLQEVLIDFWRVKNYCTLIVAYAINASNPSSTNILQNSTKTHADPDFISIPEV